MTREDIGRVAVGAPALHRVVVLTLRDCLLVKQWSRATSGDPDAAAAHLGATFRSAAEALKVIGRGPTANGLTIESDDGIVVMRKLGDEAAAGFVFDRSAPLGLVRLQVEQLSEHLMGLVPGIQATPDLPRPEVASDVPSMASANATVVMPARSQVEPAPPVDAPLVPPPPAPRPAVASTAFTAAPRPAPAAASSASAAPKERPRAVRLLEFFRRYAPDPHASMLRLSLRTGISLEALDRPEDLDEVQVDAVANAVSDILGQEQVGL